MIEIPAHVKALIFDLDGTLADTMPLHYRAWHETFAVYDVSCPQPFLESRNGMPTEMIVVEFNQHFGYQLNPPQFAREKEARARASLPSVQAIAPMAELVLHYRDELPMAVATGGRRANAMVTLESLGLKSYFAAIVTADDPVRPKPAPDIFLEAARRMAVEPTRCQVFEDADHGLAAARAAGMIATDIRPLLASTGQ